MKYRHNRKRRMIRVGFLVLSIIFIAGVVLFTIKGITKKEVVKSPEQVLKSYMNCICQKNYSEMYEMITNESKETIEKEDFSEVTNKQIKWIENKLNNRPRKRLGYLTPNSLYLPVPGFSGLQSISETRIGLFFTTGTCFWKL